MEHLLAELPNPLLTHELYIDFIDASGISCLSLPDLLNLTVTEIADIVERRETLHALVKRLPKSNYDTLNILMLHLKRVEKWSVENGMPAIKIAKVFGPLLLRASTKINSGKTSVQITTMEKLLLHAYDIFEKMSMDISSLRPLHILHRHFSHSNLLPL